MEIQFFFRLTKRATGARVDVCMLLRVKLNVKVSCAHVLYTLARLWLSSTHFCRSRISLLLTTVIVCFRD
jgi:hypothetical protein